MLHSVNVNRKGSLREMWPGLFIKFWWLSWDLFSGYPGTSIMFVEPYSLHCLFPQLKQKLWQEKNKDYSKQHCCWELHQFRGQRKRQILLNVKTMIAHWMLLPPSLHSEHFSRNGFWKCFLLVEQISFLQIKAVIILVMLFTLPQI